MAIFMRIVLALVGLCTAVSLPLSAHAQAVDASGWKLERDTTWDFAVALPPGWVILDMPIGDLRLAVRQDLPSGGKLMCQVHAKPQPETAGLNQGQINSSMVSRGPPPPQDLATEMSATGYPSTVRSSDLVWVNGFPAYVYDSSTEMRSSSNPIEQRSLLETIYVPGRTYSVTCSAGSGDAVVSSQIYDRNLPTFLGFLRSFLILPHVVN